MAIQGLALLAIGLLYESQRSLLYPGTFALVGALFVEAPFRRPRA
jgi:hypothetical protein